MSRHLAETALCLTLIIGSSPVAYAQRQVPLGRTQSLSQPPLPATLESRIEITEELKSDSQVDSRFDEKQASTPATPKKSWNVFPQARPKAEKPTTEQASATGDPSKQAKSGTSVPLRKKVLPVSVQGLFSGPSEIVDEVPAEDIVIPAAPSYDDYRPTLEMPPPESFNSRERDYNSRNEQWNQNNPEGYPIPRISPLESDGYADESDPSMEALMRQYLEDSNHQSHEYQQEIHPEASVQAAPKKWKFYKFNCLQKLWKK